MGIREKEEVRLPNDDSDFIDGRRCICIVLSLLVIADDGGRRLRWTAAAAVVVVVSSSMRSSPKNSSWSFRISSKM